ncbi:Vacuolar protein sorting-associated protein 20 [Gaertneriomyces sp. JEL0708]|nr:Vacuolar protein sorting-associated protein 20 [Gaertneriomyces sp. JEL0708]
MGNLLAPSRKRPKVTSKDKAILDLKVQRDKLKQYQKKLEAVMNREIEIAKHHLRSGDHGRALLALKKKKYQEHLLMETDKQLLNLEQLTGQIEFALVEKDIFQGLANGNAVLKQIHEEMSLEAVEKLMDDTADAIAYQAEIDNLISGNISTDDEEELMRQLDEWEAEETQAAVEALPQVPESGELHDQDAVTEASPEFPTVPTTNMPDGEEGAVQAKSQKAPAKEEPLPA